MVLISYSGTTTMGPFWEQILTERKKQTCRTPRKIPIKEGDILHMYWKVRQPFRQKPIHRIAKAICTGTYCLQYRDFAEDEGFARLDGFANSGELQQWFGSPKVFGREIYQVIQWDKLQIFPELCPDCKSILWFGSHTNNVVCMNCDAKDLGYVPAIQEAFYASRMFNTPIQEGLS